MIGWIQRGVANSREVVSSHYPVIVGMKHMKHSRLLGQYEQLMEERKIWEEMDAVDEILPVEAQLEEVCNDIIDEVTVEDRIVEGEDEAILEIRPGTGGQEAEYFGQELFGMYEKYSKDQGWRFKRYEGEGSMAEIRGYGVMSQLHYESGVHRVQRVPTTESMGRIHTSTATVAIIPHVADQQIEIKRDDLRIDTFRSSGKGGQSVNTTDSAVRIVHIPSGIIVSMQDERSQHQNRDRAMRILAARLADREAQRVAGEQAALRKSQIGSGARSERIRTYNYPQDRITDHRINISLFGIDAMLEGKLLDEFQEHLEDQHKLEIFLAKVSAVAELV